MMGLGQRRLGHREQTRELSITRTTTSDVRPAVANADRVVQTTSLQTVVFSLGRL